MDITINVDALDKTQAAVNSATDRTPVSEMELLVVGNRVDVVLRFCDTNGATPAFVTDATTVVDIGLGIPDPEGRLDYASTTSLSVTGSTRTGALNLDSTALTTSFYGGVTRIVNQQAVSMAAYVLEIRKTTAAGVVQSLGLLQVFVAFRVMPGALDDNSGASVQTVLYNPATGLVTRPTTGALVPAGGAINYVLSKASATDFDFAWVAQTGGGGGGTWGSITGTLSAQTDLQTALNAKSDLAGSTSITILGTIATGVWQGTAIADSYISSAATWNAKQSAITFGTGVQTALGINIGSAGAPVLFNGALGTPSSGAVTNLTGTASININGTVGATSPTTGAFTTVSTAGTDNTAFQINNNPTGNSLIAGNIAAVMTLNQNNGSASGLRITTQAINGGAFTGLSSYALYLAPTAISLANSYGCYVADITGSTNNYALYTGLGLVRIGDTTEATTGAAGSIVTLGGIYSTKKIISATGITALGTFDLGNASDTTLARVSAGVVSIEGATIYTQGGALGTPASGTVTNLTGTASININGTVGATTPTTGGFSTIQIAASGAANGSLLIGTSSALSSFAGTGATAQLAGTALLARAGMWGFSNDATAPGLTLTKSRNTTIGAQTVLQAGDVMGQIVFAGSDGTNYLRGALIQGRVSGSPSTGLLTGNVVISTSTADAFVDILTVSPTGVAVTGPISATRGITKRVVTASDATSITPNTDNADITYQANTQAAGTLTINADGGTPVNGQPWVLKVKCTNAQTFSWNGIFVGGTVALPTSTTGSSKIDYYSFLYDTVGPKWHFVGNALGF